MQYQREKMLYHASFVITVLTKEFFQPLHVMLMGWNNELSIVGVIYNKSLKNLLL